MLEEVQDAIQGAREAFPRGARYPCPNEWQLCSILLMLEGSDSSSLLPGLKIPALGFNSSGAEIGCTRLADGYRLTGKLHSLSP